MTTPSLDYIVGRPVEAVEDDPNGDGGEADWQIVFSGNIIVRNYDNRRTARPENIEGLALILTTMDAQNTTLQLGSELSGAVAETVTLTTSAYAISDPRFPEQQAYFPHRATTEEEVTLPDDPSEERVAEGPSEEWHRDQAELEAEEAEKPSYALTDGDPEE